MLFKLCLHLLQNLQAIDVANAVIYVLSSPPHVQVYRFCKHKSFCLAPNFAHIDNVIVSLPSDW